MSPENSTPTAEKGALADPTSTTMSPLRAMVVLGALAASEDGLSLAQLSEQLGLPKSSLFNLLKSLKKGGYIDSSNGHHRLDHEAYNLASVISRRRPLPERLHPELMRLHQSCKETVTLSVPRESWTEFLYVDVIEADSAFRFVAKIGASRPLYCTTPGLVLLAFAPQAARERYLQTAELKKITPDTITSRRALTSTIDSIKKAGVVVLKSGTIEGAAGVAAPVFDARGEVVAAVGLTTISVKVERIQAEYKADIKLAAETMSRIVGYAGEYPPKGHC